MDVRCKNCFRVYDSNYERCPHCGYLDGEPPKELYHLYPGTELLGRYVIGEVLGFGGFGITYKAWDKKFETVLAIKEYYPCGIVNRVPGTSEVILFTGKKKDIFINGLERFLDEAKNMAKFSQNNNIVNVFEYFEDNNTGYIVMELLEGISLNNYLMKQTQKLPMEEIMNITSSVCSALRDLHAIGIIHRDVSPDNIYMCENGKIKLIDFGAARFSLNEEKKMTIILKPGFAPPEQYEKINKQGPWTDIYALGATVYLLLTGSKPDESTNRKVEDKVFAPKDVDPDIPEYISNTIMKSIALDPKKRFNTIDKFENALLKRIKVKDESASAESPQTKLATTIAVGVAIVGAIIACIAMVLSGRTVKLDATKLDVWYVSETEVEQKYKDATFKDLEKQFKKLHPEVDIEYHSYLGSDYEANVTASLKGTEAPDIYDSSKLDKNLLVNTLPKDELIKLVSYNKFYLKDKVKLKTNIFNALPMGMDIPIIYANSLTATCKKNIISNINELGTEEELGEGMVGGYDTSNELYSTVFKNPPSPLMTVNPLQTFTTDELPYFFGTYRDYYSVQDIMSGNGVYHIMYVHTTPKTVMYKDCYSMNVSNNKAHDKAVKEFYKYMYSNKGQDTYFIANKSYSIPLNKMAYEEYCELNPEMKKMLTAAGVTN